MDLVLDTREEDADRAMMDSPFQVTGRDIMILVCDTTARLDTSSLQFPDASSLQARIQGPRTQYVSEGSTVALHCR